MGAEEYDSSYVRELESELNTMKTFVDKSEFGMYVTDYHTCEVLYVNHKMTDFFGGMRGADGLIGKTCWSLIYPGSKERCSFCPHKHLIGADGEPSEAYVWEHFFPEFNVWLKITSQLMRWTNGRLAQMNSYYDITESKRMQEELASLAREKEYRRMQENLQAVLDLVPVPIRIVDLETGLITYGNNAAFKLFGISSPSDVIGMSVFDFMPDVQPDGVSSVAKAKETDITSSNEFVCYKPNGERLDLLITACVIDYNGKRSSLGVMKDMAVENRHQRAQKNLQDILDKLPIPVRITDRETTRIVYANDACLKLFDYTSLDDMLGRRIIDMIPPVQSDGSASNEKIEALLGLQDSISMEIEYLSATGRIIDARITGCIVDYNGKKATLGIIKDLAAERAQRSLLLSVAEKEKEANQLKSNFLSNMSHEIRTPMNAIIGLTEIELHKKRRQENFEVYNKINTSAKNLLQIVNDILDLSKIEADKLELFSEEFELEDVLNSAQLVASPRLNGKHVELMLDISLGLPRFVIGDKTRLWQMLKNYLDNAAKFTQEGHIVLSVAEDTARSSKETIYISFTISDTGIGMSEEQLRKAFLPYEQVYNDYQKRYAGTGLGLPLSKKICELMGGSMSIDSAHGHGTVVRLTLPFVRSENNETELQALETSNLDGLRVLAVDDDEISLDIMGSLLENCGADYVAVHSGEEALEVALASPSFDIILLDYMMSGINGLETAKQLCDNIYKPSKMLLVTAYESLLVRDDLALCGIDGIIEKPFIPSAFLDKIRSVVGYKKNIDEVEATAVKFKNARVLVCEDNDVNQMVAEGMLEQFGIESVFAFNGKEGIEILNAEGPFDLILMDVHMPDMDGYEATRAIRSDPGFDDVPIISLTADAMTEVIDKCLASGMNDYLSKPFEMDDFCSMLLKWMPESKRE